MKGKTALLAILCLVLVGVLFAYPSTPPQPLHKVGDHWTPYNPPQEFPEDVKVYTIQAGDTLWQLAENFLGNPFLWPQIWENNTYITDAHWIYPGDPLVITPKKVEEVSGTPPEAPPQEEPEAQMEPVSEVTKRVAHPVPLGSESDMTCFAKVYPSGTKFPIVIKGTDDAKVKYTLTENHIAYVSGGTVEGVQAGNEYFIAEKGKILYDNHKTDLGRAWLLHGKLIILCAKEHSATARITMACASIVRGYHLIPFEQVPIPTAIITPFDTTCVPSTGKVRGVILKAQDDVFTVAQGINVLISLGKADGIEAGKFIRVFRNQKDEGNAYTLLGRLAVLEVFDHTSSCKVIESLREIEVGDEVEAE